MWTPGIFSLFKQQQQQQQQQHQQQTANSNSKQQPQPSSCHTAGHQFASFPLNARFLLPVRPPHPQWKCQRLPSPKVYEYIDIDAYLVQRGCQKYQQSCWRREGVTGPIFHAQTQAFADTVEAQFGAGAFRRLYYEQRFNFVQVRP